jgi:hypothetical protein
LDGEDRFGRASVVVFYIDNKEVFCRAGPVPRSLEPVGVEAVVLGGDAGVGAEEFGGDGGGASFADPVGEAEGEEEVVVVVAALGAVVPPASADGSGST